ncbi:MFS transporter, DHA1 family, bicyclomycin/chloramphenicol resistance protein [Mucilaginibacter mallensis]|uniref:MFS transporter, DHA1 family, bicyclomycin/chloramphenicol resistance protein n=1 Tax=Mucilaginibacter mallensis TaxID=652787 RepID=A0A1H1RS77_MUCMA|nr:multidrug effflux MFS transporter [Mucilaginibacter mallensis]SDS38514.1 MFS transporter, DHA1 family, bicyclomycin/chloramphenicol resistance protein [Mucilaginibacter mallensis]
MTRKRYFFLILILGTLTALSPFSIDMYLPGFPAIALALHTTIEQVDRSLSSFFIGLACGQLLYGPLMDRFGRKKPLYFGLGLYILISIGCFSATSINLLIILRFMQAIGSCAAGVAAMAMVRDIFPVKDNAKVFALLILVLGASPMIAPTAGSYLTAAFGWQSVFIVLMSIAILILIAVIFTLPESYENDPLFSLKPVPIITNFISVLKIPQFYTYAITTSLAFAGLFAYVAGSPSVFMEFFHVSGKLYGWIFAGLSIGFVGSSQLNNILIKYYKSEQIVIVALSGQVIAAVVFVIGALNGWFGLYGTIAMIFLVLCGIGLTNPNASALSLAPFSKNAGTAASLMGAMQLGIGALSSFAISLFSSYSAMPMALIMAVSASIALMVLLIGRRNITEKVEADPSMAVAGH